MKYIVVVVTGLSGVGKSSFINAFKGEKSMKESEDLQSGTKEPSDVVIRLRDRGSDCVIRSLDKGYRLVLVDSPGLDNSEDMPDEEISRKVVKFLKDRYQNSHIFGIVHLYDQIHRPASTAFQRFKKFRRICLRNGLVTDKVVFAITHRQHRDSSNQTSENEQWKSLIPDGAVVKPFQKGKFLSAWEVVRPFIELAATTIKPDSFIGREGDIVFLITGNVGTGKTTFINRAQEDTELPFSDGLDPCTTEPCIVVIDPVVGIPDRRLILVDTPGFDNPKLDDRTIAANIVEYLEKMPLSKVSMWGIIYICDQRNMVIGNVDELIRRRIDDRYKCLNSWKKTFLVKEQTQLVQDGIPHGKEKTGTNELLYEFPSSPESAGRIFKDILLHHVRLEDALSRRK